MQEAQKLFNKTTEHMGPLVSPIAYLDHATSKPKVKNKASYSVSSNNNISYADASTNINGIPAGRYADGGVTTVDPNQFRIGEKYKSDLAKLVKDMLDRAPKVQQQQPFVDYEEGAGPDLGTSTDGTTGPAGGTGAPDAHGEGIDTGTGTFADTVAALGNLSEQLGFPLGMTPSILSVIGMIGKGLSDISTDKAQKSEDKAASVPGVTQGHTPSNSGKLSSKGAKFDVTEKSILDNLESEQEAIDAAAAAAQAAAQASIEEQDFNDPGLDLSFDMGTGASDPSSSESDDSVSPADAESIASGGLILQEPKGHANGEQVEPQAPQGAQGGMGGIEVNPSTADTTMDTAGMGPMGLVDDMRGDDTTGVEDDLNMDTEEGAYVLNADSVELIGLRDLNDMVKEAIAVAIGSDIPLPKKIDPTKKVPIKISNGEFVVPAILVPIIGLENLEKMNKRGLAYREKNEEAQAAQEAPQGPQGPQGPQAGPAGPQAPQGPPPTAPEGVINLKRGGSVQQMNHLLQR